MKLRIVYPKDLLRTDDRKLFKFSKQVILMRYKTQYINLSLMIQEEDNDVLDMLYSYLDEDLTTNQRIDIKETIKELIED